MIVPIYIPYPKFILLWWPIYTIMNSSPFINTNPFTLGEISSQGEVHTLYSDGRRWAGTHFGWPRWSVHGSGRVCPGSIGSRSFLEPLSVSGQWPFTRSHLKSHVPHLSGWWNVRQIPSSSQQSNLTVFGQTFLPAVLTLLFCIYVLFIQYTCSTYFLFFCLLSSS